MKKTLVLVLLALVAGLPAVEITCDAPMDGFVRLGLRNELMSLEIAPQVSALLGSWVYRPEQREVIGHLKCSRQETELLPAMFLTNGVGGRELLWGKKHFHNVPFQLLEVNASPQDGRLVLMNRYLMNENIEARKEVILKEGELKATVLFTLTNHEKKPQQLALWTNLIANLGPETGYDVVAMPAKGGIKRIPLHTVFELPNDQLYLDDSMTYREVFLAPAAPWVARYSKKRPGVLAVQTDFSLLDGGFLYSYKQGPASTVHTMELVFPKRDFVQDKPVVFPLRHLFFPHLKAISTLCGNLALHWDGTSLHCESAAPQTATDMRLAFLDKDGRELGQVSLPLPDMQAGKPLTQALAAPQGTVAIRGSLGKDSPFAILPNN